MGCSACAKAAKHRAAQFEAYRKARKLRNSQVRVTNRSGVNKSGTNNKSVPVKIVSIEHKPSNKKEKNNFVN